MHRLHPICLLLALAPLHAATAQSNAQELETQLGQRQLVLRSFSADAMARYIWNNGNLEAAPVQIRSLAIFTTKSVKLKGGRLLLVGDHATLLNDAANGKLVAAGHSPMTLAIELHEADSATVIPALEEALFFPDTNAARAALPPSVAGMLPYNLSGRWRSPCNCRQIFLDGKWIQLPPDDPTLTNPKVLTIGQPEMTDAARQAHLSGTVSVVFVVSTAGAVENVWVAKPLGLGLDEAAAAAVRRYHFAPAIYRGQPVAVPLLVEINFQIF